MPGSTRKMKKQARKKPARVAAKPLKKKPIGGSNGRRPSVPARAKASHRPAAKIPTEIERRHNVAIEQYEAAVRLLQQQKFEKAKALFEKAMTGPSLELTERARVHLNTCKQRLERHTAPIRTPEDHYNVAVALINAGRLEAAEGHLHHALKLNPRAGHVYYALAAVQSLRGDIEGALENLKTAIDLEPGNRYLARNDRDFTALTEDPRFAELAYPEKSE